MTNRVERTREIAGREEDLGRHNAESGRIKADLHLTAKVVFLGMIGPGTDWYSADFNFYTNPQWQSDKEGFNVMVSYSFQSLKEIFTRVKRAEKGIEMILAPVTDHNWDWRGATDVVGCILSLEEKTKHLYEERKKAAEERRAYIYGEEALR